MIAEMLGTGRENALKIAEIAERLGLSYRAAERRIRRERLSGIEIASCSAGLYKPKDAAERRDYLARADKRGRAGFAASRAVRESLRQIDGQETMTIEQSG